MTYAHFRKVSTPRLGLLNPVICRTRAKNLKLVPDHIYNLLLLCLTASFSRCIVNMAQQEEVSRLYNTVMAHQGKAKVPWKDIILSFFDPFEAAFGILRKGARPVLQYIWSHPISLFSPSTLQRQLSAATMPWFMAEVDASMTELKQSLVDEATGVVLEIGAGTGENLKYYDMEGVERIYGVEPNLEKCAVLKGVSEKLGLKEKYCIVPYGIENTKELEEQGILPGSIDTIIAVPSRSQFFLILKLGVNG